MTSFIIFWAFGAALAWSCVLQWRRRAVFWPVLVTYRVWWSRDTHHGQFWFLLAAYGVMASVCFTIPLAAAFRF